MMMSNDPQFGVAGQSGNGFGPSMEPERQRLSGWHIALLAAFFLGLIVVVLGSVIKLPYAVMSPGPAVNIIGAKNGTGASGPMITVNGRPDYAKESTGSLDFTTVIVSGGPGYPVDVWTVLGAWLDPNKDVFPVEDIFDPNQTQEQVAEENAVQMRGSQDEATAVALRALGITVPSRTVIAGVSTESKAKFLLRRDDQFVTIGGQSVADANQIRTALQKVTPGESVKVVIKREGKDVDLTLPTSKSPEGRTVLGVTLGVVHDFPFEVKISAGDVGGPSAGMMFALGIYDVLTPGALTGGKHIAGTGTIDDAGRVGPIGGIPYKMVGAKAAGAEYFLAPADNCNEVVGRIPDGVTVVRVATFDEAKAAVEKIAKGDTGSLPACTLK